MNIPKAIEILKDILKYVKPGDPPEEHDAIRLGTEALEYISNIRHYPENPFDKLLPSETKGELNEHTQSH